MQEVVGEVNQAEIATVERLRREGKGLSAIAQETGISINTIKSHCFRHGLSGSRPIRTCMFCNTEIKTKDHFCSGGCRDGWYEIHSVDAQDTKEHDASFKALSDSDRDILTGFINAGYNARELARRLGKDPSGVLKLVKRAAVRLEKKIEENS